jgi:hypothetical protein
MSVTDHRRRRLTVAAGTVLLTLATLAVSGCSGLGRTAVGPLTYETTQKRRLQVVRLPVGGCHRLASPGAVSVTNRTLVDVVMYPTLDCSGRKTTYVATTLSGRIAPGELPWRSYTVIH